MHRPSPEGRSVFSAPQEAPPATRQIDDEFVWPRVSIERNHYQPMGGTVVLNPESHFVVGLPVLRG
jgi:hypothetical protein